MNAKICEVVTERILEQLKKGVVAWRKPWKGGGIKLPVNLKSMKTYRGINVFLLLSCGFGSRYWMSFKQCSEAKGKVKAGSKGCPVIFWNWVERMETDKESGEKKLKRIPFLRYYTVFNLDQIEGVKDPDASEKIAGPEFNPVAEAEKIVAGYKDAPKIEYAEQRAYYAPLEDRVNMPMKESFEKGAEYYSTLFHELAHSTGHESRLDREGVGKPHFFGDEIYSKEELIAEFGAAFLCGMAGIENQTIENSASYIEHWSAEFKKDPELLISSAAKAQKAVDYILGKTFEEAAEK